MTGHHLHLEWNVVSSSGNHRKLVSSSFSFHYSFQDDYGSRVSDINWNGNSLVSSQLHLGLLTVTAWLAHSYSLVRLTVTAWFAQLQLGLLTVTAWLGSQLQLGQAHSFILVRLTVAAQAVSYLQFMPQQFTEPSLEQNASLKVIIGYDACTQYVQSLCACRAHGETHSEVSSTERCSLIRESGSYKQAHNPTREGRCGYRSLL